jgi:hypothetical protein
MGIGRARIVRKNGVERNNPIGGEYAIVKNSIRSVISSEESERTRHHVPSIQAAEERTG